MMRVRKRWSNRLAISAMPLPETRPPAQPCTPRAAITEPMFGASAQHIVPRAKTPAASVYSRRAPRRDHTMPVAQPLDLFTYVVARIVPSATALISPEWTKGALTGAQLMRSINFPPSIKPGIWGVVIGAAVISVLGFTIFGWTLGGTAERMAKERAQTAVVDVLAPICVERFQQQADAPAKLTEFDNASSWDRRLIIEKGGWATVPGTDTPNSAVANACAERLGRRL